MNTPENEDEQLQSLRNAFQGLANSMEVTPVIYSDGEEDGTWEGKPIWAGKPIKGPNAAEQAKAITTAKLKEYHEKGPAALADSEPLAGILAPGESRFDKGDIVVGMGQ